MTDRRKAEATTGVSRFLCSSRPLGLAMSPPVLYVYTYTPSVRCQGGGFGCRHPGRGKAVRNRFSKRFLP